MAVKERLWAFVPWYETDTVHIHDDESDVGKVSVEIINGNVVITVTREDEAKFGPVSVVVV